MAIDPRDQRIAKYEAQLASRDRLIEQLMAKVEALTAKVAELEARLNQNSSNSSKPPSTDPPGAPRPPKKPTGRRPGGQLGHKVHKRELVPPERVDLFVDVRAPDFCDGCARRLEGEGVEALRHQTLEVPPVRPVITEYRCHGIECRGCGAVSYGELPPEAAHTFGDRLTGIIALLSGRYRMSKRMLQEMLSDLLGVRISLGSISNREAEVATALAPATREAEGFVRTSDNANADETGWYEGREHGRARRAWLWLVATSLVAIFRIETSRGGRVAREMLGEDFSGFLTTDRWSAYNWYEVALRQLCWSHLTRDFQGFIDRGGEGGRLGELLMGERNQMFDWWHRVRDGTMDRSAFEEQMKPLEERVGRLLADAVARAEPKTAGMAAELLKLEHSMWTFAHVEGLEPTNNFAERLIRHGVMYRKTSFGTQSPQGSRFVERVLTTVTTLRLQQRNVLDFLTETIAAHRRGSTRPSLLPISQTRQLAMAA